MQIQDRVNIFPFLRVNSKEIVHLRSYLKRRNTIAVNLLYLKFYQSLSQLAP